MNSFIPFFLSGLQKATLALNAARRFRYTTNFMQEAQNGHEITEMAKAALKVHKFRKSGHALMVSGSTNTSNRILQRDVFTFFQPNDGLLFELIMELN